MFVFDEKTHPFFVDYRQCVTFGNFPTPSHEFIYNIFGFIVMYAGPMTTIIVCYSSILYKLYITSRTKPHEGKNYSPLYTVPTLVDLPALYLGL